MYEKQCNCNTEEVEIKRQTLYNPQKRIHFKEYLLCKKCGQQYEKVDEPILILNEMELRQLEFERMLKGE